jgi:hypothetical protein
MHQAVNTFAPGAHPDFGTAAFGSYQLDPGVLQLSLDSNGLPAYAPLDGGSVTTVGAFLSATAIR